jgi:hypothetical protein
MIAFFHVGMDSAGRSRRPYKVAAGAVPQTRKRYEFVIRPSLEKPYFTAHLIVTGA